MNPLPTIDSPVPANYPEGAPVRIVKRSVVVESLDRSLSLLSANFGWEPFRPIDRLGDEGCKRVYMPFKMPQSARLELLQVDGDGDAAAFAANWGVGPWQITFSVNGLDAKAEDLKAKGVPFRVLRPEGGREARTLRTVMNTGLDGAVIDFVDHAEFLAGTG